MQQGTSQLISPYHPLQRSFSILSNHIRKRKVQANRHGLWEALDKPTPFWPLKGFYLGERRREERGEGGTLLSNGRIEHHAKATGQHEVMTDGAHAHIVEHAHLDTIGC